MALTIANATKDQRAGTHVQGDLKARFVTVTFDSSYPTGGEAITPADFGLTSIAFISVNAQSNVVTKTVSWDEANSKLIVVIDGGTPAEAGNTTDQSAVAVQLIVYGY